ncbi:hypothetical protein M409DRAFT_20889 [Zasmidium cellare ATCC 36951]|uniref:Uncharacterized protein n=1 Tax=Zasmidium cellare ATCC 36951 TaxID=1080233 RepID=A0A6A6CP43_ZASCE|nr:uncharacterized protein M409DRAFT_20889 [Zasmidium cellare ATCC 36951]KAF2168875.1 hypothetical protein M409DRAFT_20889 [Zasmidium cellare ATCC 36951]
MEFISYDSPSEFKAGKKSQVVRSYVTKRQHRLKREAEHKAKGEDSRSVDAEPEISGQIDTKPGEQGSTHQTKPRSRRRKKHAVALGSSSPRLPPQVSQQLMLPCRSAFDTLESFIHATMVPTHVSALGLDSSETQLASQWFSSASVFEPALYTSALLTAAPNFKSVSPDLIFYLQSATITSLVEAFANEKRRQDPALIIAVECLTFYECLYGDRNLAQKFHRPAMRRLIQAHGGRDGVEIPLAWKKVSLMADIVMEIQMGSEGESSFLMNESHQDAGILEAEWTEALKMYLPDVEGGTSGGRLPSRRRDR